MNAFSQKPASRSGDFDATLVLTAEQKARLYRRRSALLSGLLVPEQTTEVSPGVAEVMEHRERQHTRQTRELAQLVAEALAREQAQRPQVAPPPPAPIRIQPPVPPGAPPAAPQEPLAPAPVELPPAAPTRASRWQPFVSWLRPRRVPVLLQLSAVECGAACLAMILSYYGRKTAVAEVRQRCQVGRDGLSALDIVKAARSYGLRVRAVSLQGDDLST